MDQKIKILIIEDEALIAENLRYTLEDLGYEVTETCYTYDEGMAALMRNDADLVMLDINLSSSVAGHNGLALAGIMRAGSYPKPFIFLTAYNDMDTIRQATKLGPSGYLIKPVNAATVFAAIQTAIENHNLQGRDGEALPPQMDKPEEKPTFFFVKVGPRNIKVMWEDVVRMESGKNYVKIKLADSHTEYPVRGTLTFVLEQLLPEALHSQFLRVNRSVVVNHKCITAYTAEWITCDGEQHENTRYSLRELEDLISK